MDPLLSGAQEALRDTAQRWLASRASRPGGTEGIAGWDDGWWPVVTELGWLDDGLGTVEHTLLAEQAGAALLAGPWFATAGLALPAYRAAGRSVDRPATLAWAEPAPGAGTLRAAQAAVACRAEHTGDGWRLYGRKRFVPQPGADIVVVAQDPTGPALYLVDAADGRDAIRYLSTVDESRPLADVDLLAVPARPLVAADATPYVLQTVRRHVLAMLAGEAVGVAQRALDLAVRYAGIRTQFGRPIGGYQAVSHRLADAAVRVYLARSLTYRAAWCVQARADEADDAVLTATISARVAALESCESAIQTLGGIGFHWEHPLHRLYRRARWIAAFDGSTSAYRAELAAILFDPTLPASPAPARRIERRGNGPAVNQARLSPLT